MDNSLFLGRSRIISDLVEEAHQIAACDAKVLITGESGVGKELLARMIHERSQRSRRPLITINCAGVPETLLESELFGHVRGSFTDAHRDRRGLLEMANGGTVLLDEVGEMSLRMQALLLRFLENGEIQRVGSDGPQTRVDVRVISATNRDLFEQTRQKEFREDLYYRLNIVHLVIPPLRARTEDIAMLFLHYLRVLCEQHRLAPCQLSADASAQLEEYTWPGNVRELRNVAERVAVRFAGRLVSPADLSAQMANREPLRAATAPAQTTVESVIKTCYERMTNNGESFWTVVYTPFTQHDLTREVVRGVVSLGLKHTSGSYRLVAQLFNLPPTEYKRFLNFLQKNDCHMAFQNFRLVAPPANRRDDSAAPKIKAG